MSKIFVVIIIVITIISHLSLFIPSFLPPFPPSFSTLLFHPLLIKDSPSLGGVREFSVRRN